MRLMLDTHEYKTKPSKDDVRIINYRILKHLVDIDEQNLSEEILKGRTFIPSTLDIKEDGKVKRSIVSWSSQEVICLDFDNEKYIPNPDKLKKKIKVKDVTMTFEEAIDIFGNEAIFIYKTFSHTDDHPKFRVVFRLDRVITSYREFSVLMNVLLDKYPMADESCKDGSRIFYGGIGVVNFDFTNRMHIDRYINNKIYSGDMSAGDLSTYDSNNLNISLVDKSPSIVKIGEEDRIIKEYLSSVNNTPKEFCHLNDAYGYMYKMNLSEYLSDSGYLDCDNKKFNCLFHEDKSPSASIFRDKITFNYIYKCHSSHCGFTGNIIRVTERLMGIKRVEAFNYLCKIFNITIVESEWQKEQRNILDHNIYFISSESFKIEHPELYKRIKRYIPLLIVVHLLAKQYMGTNTLRDIEKNIFTASKKYIAEISKELGDLINENYSELEFTKINGDIKEVSKRIDLFSFLGLLEKIHITNLPDELKKIANLERDKKIKNTGNDKINYQNYYSIPEYDDILMTGANGQSIVLKDNNVSMMGFGRESIMRNVSRHEADKVYPMMKNLELSEKSNTDSTYIKDKVLKRIDDYTYALESEILEELINESVEKHNTKSRIRNLKNIKKSLNELVVGYGLKRERLNNVLKVKLNIGNISGYPIVIYRDDV